MLYRCCRCWSSVSSCDSSRSTRNAVTSSLSESVRSPGDLRWNARSLNSTRTPDFRGSPANDQSHALLYDELPLCQNLLEQTSATHQRKKDEVVYSVIEQSRPHFSNSVIISTACESLKKSSLHLCKNSKKKAML